MSSVWTIRRSTSDLKVAGLCGGVARQWGVDPLLVRVGFAMLALSGGVGVILYLAGWLLLPTDGRDTAPVDDLFGAATRKWPREVWITIVTIACVTAFVLFGSLTPFGIGPALVLAVIWYFGFYRPRAAEREGRRAGPPPGIQPAAPPPPFTYPGPPTPFTEAARPGSAGWSNISRIRRSRPVRLTGRGLRRRSATSPASLPRPHKPRPVRRNLIRQPNLRSSSVQPSWPRRIPRASMPSRSQRTSPARWSGRLGGFRPVGSAGQRCSHWV